MSPRLLRVALAVAVLAVSCAAAIQSDACAQPATLPLDNGAFTVGYSYQWYHRDMPPTSPVEKEWEVASLTVSYGITDRITIGLHGGYWDVTYDDFPGTDYERIVAGAGLGVRLYRFAHASIVGEFQFSEVFDMDRSESDFHKSTRSVLVGVYGRTGLAWGEHGLDVWVGPAYARDVGKNYFFGALNPLQDTSSDNVGFVTGARLSMFHRVAASGWLVFAGYVQPRVALEVRL